ncbi:MAG: 6-phosphogluconate dehydrogenase, partial [Armatimonadota bacterium]
MEFGIIGLGRMGGGLAIQAREKGMTVHGYDLFPPYQEVVDSGVVLHKTLPEMIEGMATPRIIFLYIHAGSLIDETIAKVEPLLAPGDIIVDGGNSYWGDSLRRADILRAKGFHLVDLGTSGGVSGALHGACFMVGGDPAPLDLLEPILLQLAAPGGYVRAGGPGAGHFVKLVHNGIEFGMLQAIGEGVELLARFDQKLDLPAVLSCWQHGSVVRSWLMDLMHDGLVAQEKGLEGVPPYIEDTGEVNWLVADAMRME